MHAVKLEDREPAIRAIAGHFMYSHLPTALREISEPFHDLAEDMVDELDDSPEMYAGLRHLLEAKDCFVRAALEQRPHLDQLDH